MIAWPSSVPQEFSVDSINLGSPQNAIRRTEMDVGPAKSRPLTTAAIEPLSLTIPALTKSQFADFVSFYKGDISRGALAFEITHPVFDQQISVQFAGESGHYSVSVVGGLYFRVSLNLEILP